MIKLNRKSVITVIIVIVVVALAVLTLMSNLNYNKNLPKVTTVQASYEQYNVSKQYDGVFTYTGLKSYTFPYDIRVDAILVREGNAVVAGDKLLKISFIDENLVATITSKIETNKRELALLNKQYQLDKSSYSPALYQANLEAEIAELEQKSKEQWYDTNGGIDLEIEIIEDEISVLLDENTGLTNNVASKDDLAKMQIELELNNLLQGIYTAETPEQANLARQQYDVKQLEYDILLQGFSEDKRSLAIKKNSAEIIKKIEEKEILQLKKTGGSTIKEQLSAKQNELTSFKKTRVNVETLKLDTQQKAIETLRQENDILAKSIDPLQKIEQAGGFVVADEDFIVHKITAGIDVLHKANESIFTHTTTDSMPCFKWSAEKDNFQNNFDIDSRVNVKYAVGDSYIHQDITISSKMQLDSKTEYLSIIQDDVSSPSEVQITMPHLKTSYATYLPKSALHKNSYGEMVAYAVMEKDSIFTRESYVKEQMIELLGENDRFYLVNILGDFDKVKGYVAERSTLLKDGDIVKVVQEFEGENPFSSDTSTSQAEEETVKAVVEISE